MYPNQPPQYDPQDPSRIPPQTPPQPAQNGTFQDPYQQPQAYPQPAQQQPQYQQPVQPQAPQQPAYQPIWQQQAPVQQPQQQWQPEQPVMPVDYLNQIAPQSQKKPFFSLSLPKILLFGGILVVLVLILVGIVNVFGGGTKNNLEHLSARLTATATVAETAQPNLKSSQLRSLNSTLRIYFTNTNRDITGPLSASGINAEKLNKSIVSQESTTELAGRLDDARLNAVFDRTYAREMTYQLGNTLTLMNQIYSSTNNQQTKTFLEASYKDLSQIQKSFASYNE
jgi:hypothetical protein